MIPLLNVQMLFLMGLVVQATFTLTLSLLAWSDRRTKGMIWLAAASCLDFLALLYRVNHRTASQRTWDAPGTAMLMTVAFFMYMGLRWFVVRRPLRSLRWPGLLFAVVVFTLTLQSLLPLLALYLVRAACLGVVGTTLVLLWRAEIPAMRTLSRAIAVVFGLLTLILSVRLLIPSSFDSTEEHMVTYGRQIALISLTCLDFSFVGLFVAESKRRLHEESRLDSLTGLQNRRSIEEIAARTLRQANETRRPLSLIMLDLDHFKQLNDTWGHALGDRALRAVGGELIAMVGGGNCVARLSGEEFAILLSNTGFAEAHELAERIRAGVESLRVSQGGEIAQITTSVGVSFWREGELDWGPLLHRADVALYAAKREGRNRVVLCTSKLERSANTILPRANRRDWRRALLGRGPLL